jgi:hypothetical protein
VAPAEAEAAHEKTLDVLTEMGFPLHETTFGTKFKGFGWNFDIGAKQMSCTKVKYDAYLAIFTRLAEGGPVTLKELEQVVGIMHWLSAGFSIG